MARNTIRATSLRCVETVGACTPVMGSFHTGGPRGCAAIDKSGE
jgi:hypothetical protein